MATQTRPPTLVDDPGIWFGIATGLLVLTFLVAALTRLNATETATAAILVGAMAATRLRVQVALALGVVAWAFYTGFTENAFGQLTFAGADLGRLALFAAAVSGLAAVLRHLQQAKAVRHG